MVKTIVLFMKKMALKDWGVVWPAISVLGFSGGLYGLFTGVAVIRRELALARLKQDWKVKIQPQK